MPKFKKNPSPAMYKKGPFKMKGMSFGDSSVTPEMIQQLDTQIAEMKKLGKHGAAQALIDKKSKLMDSMGKSPLSTNGTLKHTHKLMRTDARKLKPTTPKKTYVKKAGTPPTGKYTG